MGGHFDLIVLGAGFGGSLAALLGTRMGLRVALLERTHHPRFALGESSTPLADLLLEKLAREYDLPRIAPLARYGTWKHHLTELDCGLKRGFSYFQHRPGLAFPTRTDHAHELLVTASPSDEVGDTHWLRADVDAFLAREAVREGVALYEDTVVEQITAGSPWRLLARRSGESLEVSADFLLDATGSGNVLPRHLGISDRGASMRTHSEVVYAHFEGVRRFASILAERGADLSEHPFPCDAAALHHVFEDGWMYVLRFDTGLVSAGLLRRGGFGPEACDPKSLWNEALSRHPDVAAQFEAARPVRPLVRSGRLQRRLASCVGEDFALLPHGAGFVDPFFSAGIAHTLWGLSSLAEALHPACAATERGRRLQSYEQAIQQELELLDLLVDGSYRCFADFDLLCSFTALYFAAAITSEERLRKGTQRREDGFLLAGDPCYRAIVADSYREVVALTAGGVVSAADRERFREQIAGRIAPYDPVGLCDPARRHMIPYV